MSFSRPVLPRAAVEIELYFVCSDRMLETGFLLTGVSQIACEIYLTHFHLGLESIHDGPIFHWVSAFSVLRLWFRNTLQSSCRFLPTALNPQDLLSWKASSIAAMRSCFSATAIWSFPCWTSKLQCLLLKRLHFMYCTFNRGPLIWCFQRSSVTFRNIVIFKKLSRQENVFPKSEPVFIQKCLKIGALTSWVSYGNLQNDPISRSVRFAFNSLIWYLKSEIL